MTYNVINNMMDQLSLFIMEICVYIFHLNLLLLTLSFNESGSRIAGLTLNSKLTVNMVNNLRKQYHK